MCKQTGFAAVESNLRFSIYLKVSTSFSLNNDQLKRTPPFLPPSLSPLFIYNGNFLICPPLLSPPPPLYQSQNWQVNFRGKNWTFFIWRKFNTATLVSEVSLEKSKLSTAGNILTGCTFYFLWISKMSWCFLPPVWRFLAKLIICARLKHNNAEVLFKSLLEVCGVFCHM